MESKFLACKFLTFFLCFLSSRSSNPFLDCISHKISSNFTLSNTVITPNDPSYSTILQSTIQNLRFTTPTTPKPLAIITPSSYSHVQSTVTCSVKSGLRIRIRSGGHDYEGLSYTSFDLHHSPFILLDVNKLRSVTVDTDDNTAWVESGATLGELYYWVSRKSNVLGFPAGYCTTVGVGGHLSGGGFGMMARKYGLAVDNVIDMRIVDVDGRIQDRDSMGEDLFWAIRGGGGASFGVVLAWKMNLVSVPPLVTVFSLSKRLDKEATRIVNKWQHIGHNLSDDLFIRLSINPTPVLDSEERTMQATFNSLFLGTSMELIVILNDRFPELGLQKKDCIEMSWIESVVYFSIYFKGESIESLKERKPWPKSYFKVKSDYVKYPIPEEALEEIWKWCLEEESMNLLMEPHGGRMREVEESETPYPHREGNLYMIQYVKKWKEEGFEAAAKSIGLIRRIYEKMTPFVSKNPREAYVNFRDMDVGTLEATKWGFKYFKGNFRRLAMVKGMVDPSNFFCHEQSIPPLVLCEERLQTKSADPQIF